MGKVIPILKWFLIYKDNYMFSKKVENSDKRIFFNIIDKDSCYKSGRLFDEIVLEDAKLECWSTPDLIWEDKQWGLWNKVFVQDFKNLKILDKKSQVNQDGKVHFLTCGYDSYQIFTKTDSDNKYNDSWKTIKNTSIQMPVFYDINSGKPVQSVLDSFKLEQSYSGSILSCIDG